MRAHCSPEEMARSRIHGLGFFLYCALYLNPAQPIMQDKALYPRCMLCPLIYAPRCQHNAVV